MSSYRPLALALSSFLALVLSCGPEPAEQGSTRSAAVSAAAAPADAPRGGNKLLPVMTRNLYLGADLGDVIAAADFPAFLAATTAVWQMVQKNDFHVRAEAIADEIADEAPALVGLQEAYLWRIQSPGDFLAGGTEPATTVVYDYVQDLLDALAARGLVYRVAARVTLFDFEAPILTGDDVRLTDHGVILARDDVQTTDPVEQPFTTLLPLQVLGQQLFVTRGWVSVEAKFRGEWLRFVSTHLEAFHPQIRTIQAMELGAALRDETLPVVLVGDLNSLPGTEGEAALAAEGFLDAWDALEPEAAGFSCCFLEDLTIADAALDSRIDYVLYRGALVPRAIEVIGDEAQVSGLWPSDHAGVAASLRIALPGRDGTGRPR